MNVLLGTAAIGLLAVLLATPLVRRFCLRLGIVDRPDQHRKIHGRVVPVAGGLAVLVGISLAVLFALFVRSPWQAELWQELPFLGALAASAILISAVGLLDDCVGLRGRQKLMGQVLACSILVLAGLTIRHVQVLDWHLELGLLAFPFSLFWLLGSINALNLVDGADGLATSIGVILSLAVAGMALLTGHPTDALLALAVAGSLAGFLCYNFPPASIFLGDTGSMLIGLLIGALAIRSSLKGPATVALTAAIAIWAIPILDVSMAILRRRLTGRSIYDTDRGHLHHCLLGRGFSGVRMLAGVATLCACTAVGALASVYRQNEILALGSVAAVVATLVATRLFGHEEMLLVARHLKSLGLSLVHLQNPAAAVPREVCSRLQGNRQWDELWETLIEFAMRFDLNAVQMNVSLPAHHEEYHARWERPGNKRRDEQWHTDIPLVAGEITVGRLRIAGGCADGSVCAWMGELIAGLKPFETHMQALLNELPPRGVPGSKVPVLHLLSDNSGLESESRKRDVPKQPATTT
jgi:UDP-GlcNAc:undecaprenyl-phosphate GlcNAc-1-phosphate transferase